MLVSCLLNDKIGTAARYTLEFVLNNRGVFFNWINQPESGRLVIIYGNEIKLEQSNTCYLHIPCRFDLASLHHTNLSWQEIKIEQTAVPVIGLQASEQEIPFDLLATVYYHLTRIGEKSYINPDDVNKDISSQLLYRYGRFKLPVVDMLCCWFDDIIGKKQVPLLKKALFPSGQVCGVAVTHDIDRIYATHPVKKWLLKKINGLTSFGSIKNEMLDQADQRLWIFDRLLADYQELGIRATLFFLARKMENRSYRYDIRTKKFRMLFQSLVQKKYEIALHASRYAFSRRKRYLRERRRLNKALGNKITGVRQHYLRCLFPELWRIAANMGLLYDSSMTYRRISGFRAGTGHPFYCYDYNRGNLLPVIECPAIFFENTLPNEGNDLEKSIAEISSLMAQVKKYQGVMVALWHQDNLYENKPYPQIWSKFLELIDHDTMYLDTVQGQIEWYDLRAKIKIKHIQQDEKGWRIRLDLPENITKFTLMLPEGTVRVDIPDINVAYSVKNKYLTIDMINQINVLDLNLGLKP
jgi:hypothetical protein